GLSDTHRCTGCGLTWEHREKWMYTNGHTLKLIPDIEPDALVTIDDARKHIFPDVPAPTWRSWLMQDRDRIDAGEPPKLPEQGTDVRGHTLYRVADIDALVTRRANPTRRGPKISQTG